MRRRAAGDGAQVRLGVELRHHQLEGDAGGPVLTRTEGHGDL